MNYLLLLIAASFLIMPAREAVASGTAEVHLPENESPLWEPEPEAPNDDIQNNNTVTVTVEVEVPLPEPEDQSPDYQPLSEDESPDPEPLAPDDETQNNNMDTAPVEEVPLPEPEDQSPDYQPLPEDESPDPEPLAPDDETQNNNMVTAPAEEVVEEIHVPGEPPIEEIHLPANQSPDPLPPIDETYDMIMAMKNQTIPSKCFVDVALGNYLKVWCDISVPIGMHVKAEIKDGSCDDFNEVASGSFFTKGIASPVFLPKISDEEKKMGTFDHAYCARMDIFVGVVEGDGQVGEQEVSVLDRRFPMKITYRYMERVIDESGEIEKQLSSAVLTDENTKVEEGNMELVIGLSVLAGALVTLSLVAMIYGRKKKSTQSRWQEIQRKEAVAIEEEGEGDGNGDDVEAATISISSKEINDLL